MLRQYDVVQIITTKRVRYLSGPPGQSSSPHGNWSIVGFIEGDGLIAKDSTLARVPVADLRKIGSFDHNTFIEEISQVGYLKKVKINMPAHLSNVLEMNVAEARRLLKDHNFKVEAKSTGERDAITEKVARLTNGKESKRAREN